MLNILNNLITVYYLCLDFRISIMAYARSGWICLFIIITLYSILLYITTVKTYNPTTNINISRIQMQTYANTRLKPLPINSTTTPAFSCKPKRQITFLKTHKTASSTLQNILYRFGDDRNLTFAFQYSSEHTRGTFEKWKSSGTSSNRSQTSLIFQ